MYASTTSVGRGTGRTDDWSCLSGIAATSPAASSSCKLKDVFQGPLVGLRPELAAVGRIHQTNAQSDPVAHFAHRPFEQGPHAEALTDLARVQALAAKSVDRGARSHPESAHAREGVGELLGQSIAEVGPFSLRRQLANGSTAIATGAPPREPPEPVRRGEHSRIGSASNSSRRSVS